MVNKLFGMGAAVLILISVASAYSDTFSTDVETLSTEQPKTITPEEIKVVQLILSVVLILLATLCVATAILIYQQSKKVKKT